MPTTQITFGLRRRYASMTAVGSAWFGREQQDVGAVDKVLPVGVVGGHAVLQIRGDQDPEHARDRDQVTRPVYDREVGQLRAREDAAAQRQVGPQLHRVAAVVEVLAPTVLVHEVDAAIRAARVEEERREVEPVAGERVAHERAVVIVADRADVRRALAELRKQAARVPAGLADAVDVAGEVALDRPVDVIARPIHVGVDTGPADHDSVELSVMSRQVRNPGSTVTRFMRPRYARRDPRATLHRDVEEASVERHAMW
jgi:hypothetical protein